MNQGVVVVMTFVPPNDESGRYTDEYSSVAISGLLAIDTNTMIPGLRLIQFIDDSGRTRSGWVASDGSAVGTVGNFASNFELAQAALAAGEPLDSFAEKH